MAVSSARLVSLVTIFLELLATLSWRHWHAQGWFAGDDDAPRPVACFVSTGMCEAGFAR